MRTPDFAIIRSAYERKGYKFYVTGPYNLNIWGIRANDSKSNKFDDVIGVSFYEKADQQNPRILCWNATTDPGKYWLMNPMAIGGTAILVPGQYRGAYKLGIHGRSSKSPYQALEQKDSMLYVRDNDKDTELDFSLYRDENKLKVHGFRANIKSNIHRASAWKVVQLVERYSAACQVIQDPAGFKFLISLVNKYIQHGFPNSLTYTLFEESDVW
jgi:hypothetical protein